MNKVKKSQRSIDVSVEVWMFSGAFTMFLIGCVVSLSLLSIPNAFLNTIIMYFHLLAIYSWPYGSKPYLGGNAEKDENMASLIYVKSQIFYEKQCNIYTYRAKYYSIWYVIPVNYFLLFRRKHISFRCRPISFKRQTKYRNLLVSQWVEFERSRFFALDSCI